MRGIHILTIACLTLAFETCFAFSRSASYFGIGYLVSDVMGKTAAQKDGSAGFSGAADYPLFGQGQFQISNDWFFAPGVSYTILPRTMSGDSGTESTLHISLPFGTNFSDRKVLVWDWSVGPGLTQASITGKGGTVQLNNGTGTATFAKPGRSATFRKLTWDAGTSVTFGRSRIALDLMFENILSGEKRVESVMLSYAFRVGGNAP